MLNRLSFSLLFLTLALTANLAFAQRGFVSNANASAAGLNVAWSTQLGISARGKLVDWQLIVDEDNSTVYYVVTAGNRRELYAQSDLNPFGQPWGVDGAKAKAEERKELLDLEYKYYEKDIEVTVSSFVVPNTTILALGGDGRVVSIDGNTGAVNWTQAVGDPTLPSSGLGASKKHVAVTNGSRVYCLDFDTGRTLWDRKCKHSVVSSPICSEDNVYVPLANGRLQALGMEKLGVDTFTLVGHGESRARPVITEQNVVWTNEGGDVNIAPISGRRTVSFRLNASAPIVSAATAGLGLIYSASVDGFVYGIDEQVGKLDWNVSTGAGVTQSPVLHGGHLYVVTDADKLFRLDAKEGLFSDRWQDPLSGIKKIVGFGKQTIYCLDSGGGLVGVDRETKAVTKRIASSNIELVLTNDITDRLFLATETGFVQCLHETASLQPKLLDAEGMGSGTRGSGSKDGSGTKGSGTKGSGTKDGSSTKDSDNPFGESSDDDGSNPFGESSDEDEDEDDSNPFGG